MGSGFAEFAVKFEGFIDDHIGGNIGQIGELVSGDTQKGKFHPADAGKFPVLGVGGDGGVKLGMLLPNAVNEVPGKAVGVGGFAVGVGRVGVVLVRGIGKGLGQREGVGYFRKT